MSTFAKHIADLQLLEKEKLTLVAALHLDEMQRKHTLFREGAVLALMPQTRYNEDRIQSLETRITEIMEEVQAEKCEL